MPTLGEQVAELRSRFNSFEEQNAKEHGEFVTHDKMNLALSSVITPEQIATTFNQVLESRGIGQVPQSVKVDASTKIRVALIGAGGMIIVGILAYLAGKGGHP